MAEQHDGAGRSQIRPGTTKREATLGGWHRCIESKPRESEGVRQAGIRGRFFVPEVRWGRNMRGFWLSVKLRETVRGSPWGFSPREPAAFPPLRRPDRARTGGPPSRLTRGVVLGFGPDVMSSGTHVSSPGNPKTQILVPSATLAGGRSPDLADGLHGTPARGVRAPPRWGVAEASSALLRGAFLGSAKAGAAHRLLVTGVGGVGLVLACMRMRGVLRFEAPFSLPHSCVAGP